MSLPTVLRIEGELTIYRASELAQELRGAMAALPTGEPLEIDLSGVTEMDCAGVQLLMATRRSATDTRRALRVAGGSPVVAEVFATLQLAPNFADAH